MKMQIDRLLETVLILLNKKQVTARELAEKFDVTTRTIYRDIDALSLAGIPVYSTKGKGGGIGLLKEYTIDKTFLTEKEQKDMIFALQSLSASHYPDIEAIIGKISQIFKSDADTNWIEVDFSYWGSGKEEKEKFNWLREAILSKRLISFDYYNSYGTKTSRFVEALKLVFKGRAWYLCGFCREKQDYRIFRISRIDQLTLHDIFFDRKLPVDFNIYGKETLAPKTIVLKLKFSQEAAYRVHDDFNNGTIEYDGSSFITTSEYPYDEWVIGYILSFGSMAEVLTPDYIREIVVMRAEAIINKYN